MVGHIGHERRRAAPLVARVVALLVVVVAAVGACSGDEDGQPPSTAPRGTTVTEPSPPAADAVARPTIEGPVTGPGSVVLGAAPPDLSALGYTQEEFFLSGTAEAYTSATPLSSDGRWDVTPSTSAEYATRIVVRRPLDPAAFDGTVVVEWLNVSGGLDADPDWVYSHVELTRSGTVWVGVSAQRAGVEGGGNSLGAVMALKNAAPERYGALAHPGDDYSYDIFSQAGAAVWFDADRVLGGLEPQRVLAMGESQSAFRLSTYVDAVAPTSDVYDGYFVHSRAAVGAPLSADVPAPDPTLVRTDLDVPVLVFQSETDMVGDTFGYHRARQPDSDVLRTWEVAGTAHADAYNLGIGDADDGSGAADQALFDAMTAPPTSVYDGIISCDAPINTGPQTYVVRAAVDALGQWVRTGTPPPSMPPLEVDDAGTGFVVDEVGNARGGIRTPQVDVPVAVLSGLGQSGSGFCFLFGTTVPLSDEAFAAAHPSSDAFLTAWDAALDDAVDGGAVLEADVENLRRAARTAVGR